MKPTAEEAKAAKHIAKLINEKRGQAVNNPVEKEAGNAGKQLADLINRKRGGIK